MNRINIKNKYQNVGIFRLVLSLFKTLPVRRRKQFFLLIILMVCASFSEVLSIGAVLPFLGVLSAPEKLFYASSFSPVIKMLCLESPADLLLPLTMLFAVATLIAGAVRLCLIWATNRLSFLAGADISMEIYRRTLYQPYAIHVSRNSSEVIVSISGKTNEVIFNVMTPSLNIMSSTLILISILSALFFIDYKIAALAIIGFGGIYYSIIKLVRHRLMVNGTIIAQNSTELVKGLQEGLGGIRDVLLDGTQRTFVDSYRAADSVLREAQGNNLFLGIFPRYGVETLGMLLIAGLAYVLASSGEDITMAIPILGAFAVGAQRLLPVLQQAYNSWASIRGGRSSLQDVLTMLHQPLPEYLNDESLLKPIGFSREIILKDVSFGYTFDRANVLCNFNLRIVKGSRVGFVGETGSGKSTLIDILMALLQPKSGELIVDGTPITGLNCRRWQRHIAHVPQSIFLADTTIAENIAFGVPKEQVDMELVRASACQAQLADTIESWPQKYQTNVGERGVRLSGGQRQRIGIARALYKRADVIIFDEATSALDTETETSVMESIKSLKGSLTILIIAHRLSTLAGCDQVIQLVDGCGHRVEIQDGKISQVK